MGTRLEDGPARTDSGAMIDVHPRFLPFALCLGMFLAASLPALAVPDVVERAFAAKYPEAEEVGDWDRDSHDYWEIKFELDGKKFRADFHADGRWRETERSIEFEDLPQAVQRAIEERYPDEKINEIESVDSAEKGRFFDVEFKRPGKNHDVEFRADGTRVADE